MLAVYAQPLWRRAPLQLRVRSLSTTGFCAMARNYAEAIKALNGLQSNFATIDALRKSSIGNVNQRALPEMIGYAQRMGYEPSDFDCLNIIHIAGTKGKGSTSAFISSILTQYADSTPATSSNGIRKIGLFTSPHLRSVRERIQINNKPVSEELFAKYFFDMWDRLEATMPKQTPQEAAETPPKPFYFRYLTLMALHMYLCEGVDTVILECGIGGEYDSTNIIVRPTITAVTSLGIDHEAILGKTIEEIAWHKAGIFKKHQKVRQAFTAENQPPAALRVLQDRAQQQGLELVVVPRHRDIDQETAELGLDADFQKTNASLAVVVSEAMLKERGVLYGQNSAVSSDGVLPEKFRAGLAQVEWAGRCQTLTKGPVTWYMDGAHTMESLKPVASWYASHVSSIDSQAAQKRILFFNQQTRDAPALARNLHRALREAVSQGEAKSDNTRLGATDTKLRTSPSSNAPLFDHAIFTTNVTYSATGSGTAGYKPDLVSINESSADVEALKVQRELAAVWQGLDSGCETHVTASIQEAVGMVNAIAAGERKEMSKEDGMSSLVACNASVLATGSLHLIGGLLEVLD